MAIFNRQSGPRVEPGVKHDVRAAFVPLLEGSRYDADDIVVAPLVGASSQGGLSIDGDAGENCWIAFDRRSLDSAQIAIKVRRKARKLSNVVVFVGHIKGDLILQLQGHDSQFVLGDSRVFSGRISLGTDSRIIIGEHTTAMNLIVSAHRGRVEVGRDCMISGPVVIEAAMHHGLVYLEDGQARLDTRTPEVVIGDHVWLGARSTVMGRARIGSGSIVGACAVVGGEVLSHTAVAGNPARSLRDSVTWTRQATTWDQRTQDYLHEIGVAMQPTGDMPAAADATQPSRNGAQI